jgi:hypothetical protein
VELGRIGDLTSETDGLTKLLERLFSHADGGRVRVLVREVLPDTATVRGGSCDTVKNDLDIGARGIVFRYAILRVYDLEQIVPVRKEGLVLDFFVCVKIAGNLCHDINLLYDPLGGLICSEESIPPEPMTEGS